MKITIIFERFIVLLWKNLNFQLFCFCFSVVYVETIYAEAQPGPTLTALYFEFAYSLLRKIAEREFQILTLMNFHEPHIIFNDLHPLIRLYRKMASSNTSRLEAHPGFFRLLIKGIFDPYVL